MKSATLLMFTRQMKRAETGGSTRIFCPDAIGWQTKAIACPYASYSGIVVLRFIIVFPTDGLPLSIQKSGKRKVSRCCARKRNTTTLAGHIRLCVLGTLIYENVKLERRGRLIWTGLCIHTPLPPHSPKFFIYLFNSVTKKPLLSRKILKAPPPSKLCPWLWE